MAGMTHVLEVLSIVLNYPQESSGGTIAGVSLSEKCLLNSTVRPSLPGDPFAWEFIDFVVSAKDMLPQKGYIVH